MKPYKKPLLITSLLLALLVLVAHAPQRAAATNNPLFATLAQVQQMIASALSPVQSSLEGLTTRVGNLEATVTPMPGQIAGLQTNQSSQASQLTNLDNRVDKLETSSSSGKQFILYDANYQRLGILMSGAGLYESKTIYNETLGKIISIGNDGSVGPFGYTGIATEYTSSDCSGTPYLNLNFDYDHLFPIGKGEYAIVNTSATPTSQLIRSIYDVTLFPPSCTQTNQTMDNQMPLIKVPYPYPNQIATPLKIKYQ